MRFHHPHGKVPSVRDAVVGSPDGVILQFGGNDLAALKGHTDRVGTVVGKLSRFVVGIRERCPRIRLVVICSILPRHVVNDVEFSRDAMAVNELMRRRFSGNSAVVFSPHDRGTWALFLDRDGVHLQECRGRGLRHTDACTGMFKYLKSLRGKVCLVRRTVNR